MENRRSNSFNHGFLLGLIVGASLVFFLFTKKGRELLKVISEEGIEGINGLSDLFGDEDEAEEKAQKASKVQKVQEEQEDLDEEMTSLDVHHYEEPVTIRPVARMRTTSRRLFKGIPKRH